MTKYAHLGLYWVCPVVMCSQRVVLLHGVATYVKDFILEKNLVVSKRMVVNQKGREGDLSAVRNL